MLELELPAKPSRDGVFPAAKVRTGSAQGLLMLPAMIRQSLGKVWGSQNHFENPSPVANGIIVAVLLFVICSQKQVDNIHIVDTSCLGCSPCHKH